MDIRQLRFYNRFTNCVGRTVAVLSTAGLFLVLTSCVSFPLPPTGDDAGKWGFVDVRIQYRPNIETLLSAWKSNPDLPETSTLNQKP